MFDIDELIDRLEAAEKERDDLRTKIARMERQEPIGGMLEVSPHNYELMWYRPVPFGAKLYTLPGAQPAPSVPDGWLRAIDEALVVANVGVANASDTYEQAKAKLDNLIGFHVDVATDPAVNGGWKLVPIEPFHERLRADLENSRGLAEAQKFKEKESD